MADRAPSITTGAKLGVVLTALLSVALFIGLGIREDHARCAQSNESNKQIRTFLSELLSDPKTTATAKDYVTQLALKDFPQRAC